VRHVEDEINVFAQTSKKVLHKFKTKYFDTIYADDTTQDFVSVLSHAEAVCSRIKKDTPHVTHVSFQSDNARCYTSSSMLYAAFIIAKQAGLKLVNFIHTGIQVGKGPIDGNFATAMRHILQFCNMGNNGVTPEDIVTALSTNGGVKNSVAKMISLDRDTMGLFLKKHSHITERLAPAKNHAEARFDINTITMTSFQELVLVKKFDLRNQQRRHLLCILLWTAMTKIQPTRQIVVMVS
jgi:hypothetical protein